ncbi:MAG: TIGR01459 family HAD-type hydrolase [Azospirillaceae bacterium]
MTGSAAATGRAEPIAGLAALASRYDGFVVDQWGVLHDGERAYPGAAEALTALRRAGKRVVILSNSGKRAALNEARMAALDLGPEGYDAVITSGEACWHDLAERDDPFYAGLGRRCLLFSRGGDTSVVDGLDLEVVTEAGRADFLLLTGADEAETTLDDFDPVLRAARAADLPLVCANPDIVGIAGGRLIASPGAIAARYEALGGRVRYLGKPHPEIYGHCRRALGAIPDERVIAIGDSLQHDIAGGRAAGFATALVAGGIHRDALAEPLAAGDRAALDRALAPLAERHGAVPDFVLPAFVW